MRNFGFRFLSICLGLALLSGCYAPYEDDAPEVDKGIYGPLTDGTITIPGVDTQYLQEPNRRAQVAYNGYELPGTIVVDPHAKFLYFVEAPGQATRYPIAVGREGRGFRGNATIRRLEVWPGWTPTKNMLRREPELYGPFAGGIPGGVASPLGARALYLYRGGRDTLYRIHGTNDMTSIGNATSAGCIRMFNQDVIHLFERTPMGTEVVVRTYDESVAAEGFELANRGVELPPKPIDPDVVFAAIEAQKQRELLLE